MDVQKNLENLQGWLLYGKQTLMNSIIQHVLRTPFPVHLMYPKTLCSVYCCVLHHWIQYRGSAGVRSESRATVFTIIQGGRWVGVAKTKSRPYFIIHFRTAEMMSLVDFVTPHFRIANLAWNFLSLEPFFPNAANVRHNRNNYYFGMSSSLRRHGKCNWIYFQNYKMN